MAYQFSGIFLNASPDALPALLEATGGVGREVAPPVPLIAISLCDEYDLDAEPWNPLNFPLLEWSRGNPQVTLVYAWVQCHGGDCDQAGFAARAGRIIHVEAMAEDDDRSDTPLGRLLAHLGVRLERGVFAPLERGFFGRR